MSILDDNEVAAALKKRGVGYRDRQSVVSWWLFSNPGETLLLVRYDGPNLRVDHDGNVSEAPVPTAETRTDRFQEWVDRQEGDDT